MPNLQPIPTIRYAGDARDISTRIAPPYDVLDEGPKQQLLARDPHNIVAIDLPVTPPKTVGPDSAYHHAGQTMQQWLRDGILKRHDEPALFAYEQIYTVGQQTYHRRGIIGGLRIEPFGRRGGGIHRHEMTIQSGTDDRYKLMAVTGAQLSPVFAVYHDPQASVVGSLASIFDAEPDFHGSTDNDHVQHRVWTIRAAEAIQSLQKFFDKTDVFIADGHHRYTTALNFAKNVKKGSDPILTFSELCLFVLVAIEDPGMIVLPTHRIIRGLQNFSMDQLAKLIAQRPNLKLTSSPLGEVPRPRGGGGTPDYDALLAAMPQAGPHAMGIFDPATGDSFILTTVDDDPLQSILPDKPAVWRKLDVAVLHELLIDRVLKPAFGGQDVSFLYSADVVDTLRIARAEPGRLAVFMQPTKLDDVCAVSLAGEVMPPKSTYFFPKLATGLVIHPLK